MDKFVLQKEIVSHKINGDGSNYTDAHLSNITPLNNTLTNTNFTKIIVGFKAYIIYIVYVKFYKNLKSFDIYVIETN
jgi:hypothetical protein